MLQRPSSGGVLGEGYTEIIYTKYLRLPGQKREGETQREKTKPEQEGNL